MATVLQWRKFNFFDVKHNIDDGNLSETLKDTNITCTSSGRGIIFIGDSNGWVHSLNRQLQISSFSAHDQAVKIIQALDNSNLLLTVQGNTSGPSEIKIWCPERQNSQGLPLCLRVLRPDPRPSHSGSKGSPHAAPTRPIVSAISLHPNNALLAVGFTDGSVLLYRGDVRRERGCKARVIVTFGSGAITNLHLKHAQKTCHLFATTKNNVYCVNCSTKDKETTVELDTSGCASGCSALADSKHENELLIARQDAIYTYRTDSKASCYVFEGEKVSLCWFRGYLIVVATEATSSRLSNISPTVLTVYDPLNKLVTLSTVVEGFVDVVGEWGGLYVVVHGPSLLHLSEKDLQSKLELLFKKNQFDIAINLAKMQCCDQEDVAEILKQYGDWLYAKGNTVAAMEQYIKTIPHLEASYVIKKFLDTHHIDNLTTYLQALHKSGNATSDHTTLMLNCYTRLRDSKQLDNFIKEGDIECDVALGIKVCRGAGYFDHALALASKHGLHGHYISILMEDKKDFQAALRYISTLPFEDAKDNILLHGSSLLNHIPERVTDFLVVLCTEYKPTGEPPLILEDRAASPPLRAPFADPESFEYLLVGHSEASIAFLERLMARRPLSKHLNTTLLAELLHQFSLAPEGQDQNAIEEKTLKMLRTDSVSFDRDHALLLCDKHKFFSGKLVLWEQAGMFEELLSWHASTGDFSAVVDVCRRHGDDTPQLWASALRLVTAETSAFPPHSDVLNEVLNKIDELELLPSLEVVDLLTSSPYVTLGQVRSYLLRVVASHSSSFASEATMTQTLKEETARMKESIQSITTDTVEFTSTKCNVCNNNLDLPSVHFLCRHSFHVHCFESYSENDSECPICFPENKKLRESVAAQERNASRHEILQEQLDKSSDSFSVVADFMGRGIFTSHQMLLDCNPSPNTTTIPNSECSIRALERTNQELAGANGEGRLRLTEAYRGAGSVQPEQVSEGRLRQRAASRDAGVSPFPSAHAEGLLRAPDHKPKTPTPSPSSSERRTLNLNPFSSTPQHVLPLPPNPSGDGSHSISSSLSNDSPLVRRSAAFHMKTENPFEEDSPVLSPAGDDFATEEDDGLNPFADGYVDPSNPFATDMDDEEKPRKGPSAGRRGANNNPFDNDDSMNPFEA